MAGIFDNKKLSWIYYIRISFTIVNLGIVPWVTGYETVFSHLHLFISLGITLNKEQEQAALKLTSTSPTISIKNGKLALKTRGVYPLLNLLAAVTWLTPLGSRRRFYSI